MIELDDSVELVAAFLGAVRMGAVPVPINPWANFSTQAIAHSHAKLLISENAELDIPCEALTGTELTAATCQDIHLQAPPEPAHSEDQAFWLYSSGSTGHPKAVVHLHRDVSGACENYAGEVLGMKATDRCLSTAKLFHAYGLGGGLLFPLWHGASVTYLRGKPGPSALCAAIGQFGVTVLFSVPALYNAVVRRDHELSMPSLRRCVSAAEPLAPAVWEHWQRKTGIEILDGVGSTEMLHIYCSNRPGGVVAGSAGVPVPGYELKLRPGRMDDDDGEDEPQELWVRGPSTFDRYWHNQQATRSAFCGQWFRTGDCFRLDSDGLYWYLGRVDDMLKISGLWISANHIEARLAAHPLVNESAAISVEARGSNRIKAFVVVNGDLITPNEKPSLLASLRKWCAQGLPADHVPHHFELIDALPKSTGGKVQRHILREKLTSAPQSESRESNV
ncbi:Benzoate--CoA ligase [Tsukamurella pulmonis]|nr:Benzoate--CoA ligase [Tsukamurella pulmonis]